jgi:predicted HAD superfamily Cof-like phosphohydrolase
MSRTRRELVQTFTDGQLVDETWIDVEEHPSDLGRIYAHQALRDAHAALKTATGRDLTDALVTTVLVAAVEALIPLVLATDGSDDLIEVDDQPDEKSQDR